MRERSMFSPCRGEEEDDDDDGERKNEETVNGWLTHNIRELCVVRSLYEASLSMSTMPYICGLQNAAQ